MLSPASLGAMTYIWALQGGVSLIASLALLAVKIFAFVDALTRRPDAFVAAGKMTKQAWLLILGLSAVAAFLFSALALSGHATALLGTGFCGGFTTYSSFAVQTHGQGRRRGTAYAAATIGVSLGACALGFALYA